MEKTNVVYGLFNNSGDGDTCIWHFGVCLNEIEAYEKWESYLNHGYWIGEIKVL